MSEQEKENLIQLPVNTSAYRMPVGKQLFILSAVLVGIFAIGVTFQTVKNLNAGGNNTAGVSTIEDDSNDREERVDPFDDMRLFADMAIVIDVRNNEVIFEKQADEVWPLASVTKLMTGLLASELVERGTKITVTKEALAQDGDSGLLLGETFTYEDLSDLTLLTSSNDGAYALAAAAGAKLDSNSPAEAFVKAMNIRAEELKLDTVYFRNPTGLDLTENEGGAYGSARDVAKLMQFILENKPEILEDTTKVKDSVYNISGELHQAANTNTAVSAIPGLIGSKTGYTTLSGGNLAVAFDAGVDRPIIVVVLGSTHQGRFADVVRLVEATKDKLANEE